MFGILVDAAAQGFRVLEGSERTIDAPQNVAQENLIGRALELIAAMGAPNAHHHPHPLEIAEDGLQKLLRQLLFLGNVPDPRCLAAGILASQDDQGLQGVKTLLGNPHAE